jgi:hypothetical protein
MTETPRADGVQQGLLALISGFAAASVQSQAQEVICGEPAGQTQHQNAEDQIANQGDEAAGGPAQRQPPGGIEPGQAGLPKLDAQLFDTKPAVHPPLGWAEEAGQIWGCQDQPTSGRAG